MNRPRIADRVTVSRAARVIPTYDVGAPEKNPMFFEKRVYQGSCGKVYPLPFIDKVCDEPVDKSYDAVTLENRFIRLVMLPEIGGRIFQGVDKCNDDYDFFYRQDVIKPALVGLAGPWISGGVEFNWPQHHRPSTFMPTDVYIEKGADGSTTVWMSEHDPMTRMKGMHGICLRPDSAVVELKARLYNRTPVTQTFLWWANVAARVHDQYQSFFPPDVHYVADHAVRAQSEFPIANGHYYGVDYSGRPGANDLSWYKNLPVPTSYMVCESDYGFFGGYDHKAKGGFVHVANRHISPGKKQWTWGNHEFGHAWDRELTDQNGPYVELMAGVYTDNQPDFSYLAPYETKTFSQFWWPYQNIGPIKNATRDAAISFDVLENQIQVGVASSKSIANALLMVRCNGELVSSAPLSVAPGKTATKQFQASLNGDEMFDINLLDASNNVLVAYTHKLESSCDLRKRKVAVEPPKPEEAQTNESLYLTGEHLEQYRHPTRDPKEYWKLALERDPHDSRCNISLGRAAFNKGILKEAVAHFRRANERLTDIHPNPRNGEASYYLGLSYRYLGDFELAYKALYKSTWNYEWRSAAYYQMALIDCQRKDWHQAIEHCAISIETNTQNNKIYCIKYLAEKRLEIEHSGDVETLLKRDPLDYFARFALGQSKELLAACRNDAQTILDVCYDLNDAGFYPEALELIRLHHANSIPIASVPNPLRESQLTRYLEAYLLDQMGHPQEAKVILDEAKGLSSDYLFPSRLDDQLVLEWVLDKHYDSNAAFGLGNYFYNVKRHDDAIEMWERSAFNRTESNNATVFRNLGLAYWNQRGDIAKARSCYDKAMQIAPHDARIFYEADQLSKKIGDSAEVRLMKLMARPELVDQRDDCTIELASLYTENGQPIEALELLLNRRFHPWEGGEGQVVEQYKRARIEIGKQLLNQDNAAEALEQFELALQPPENLGEAFHLLQAKADVCYWKGRALRKLGQQEQAITQFKLSAYEKNDFQDMAVTIHSEKSFYRGMSLLALGEMEAASKLFKELMQFADDLNQTDAQIDYFATSLPLLLVFDEDPNVQAKMQAFQLRTLAEKGLQFVGQGSDEKKAELHHEP